MSVGFPFFDPRAKPLSSNGLPQAGCYYCFFLTGTLTPANVYADNLVTPLSQPVPGSVNPTGGTVADSAGRFAVMYLDPSVTYRAQLYSAAGVLLEDTDPFKAPGSPSVAFSNGTAAAPGIAFTNYLNTGLYIPSANSLGFATNGLAAGSISQNQAWSLPAANGAATMTIAAASGFYAAVLNGNSTSANSFGLEVSAGTTAADVAMLIQNQAASATFLEIFGDGHGTLGPTSSVGLSWNTAGAFTLAAPSSGTSLTVNGAANSTALIINASTTASDSFGLYVQAGTNTSDYALEIENAAASSIYMKIAGNGETFIIEPPAGSTPPSGTHQVGYLDSPVRQISASGNVGLTDRSKTIELTGGSAQTLTFPSTFTISGALVMVVNLSGNSWTMAAAGTMHWLSGGSSTSGSRTMANNGFATFYQLGTDWYLLGGSGIS